MANVKPSSTFCFVNINEPLALTRFSLSNKNNNNMFVLFFIVPSKNQYIYIYNNVCTMYVYTQYKCTLKIN